MSYGVAPAPKPLKVTFLLIPVLGGIQSFEQTRPRRDSAHGWLKKFVEPMFDESIEHVAVLYEGERRDMFVGDTSSINGRHIRNVRATEIYRNNALVNGLATNPEELPAISGPAVLFPDYIIWS